MCYGDTQSNVLYADRFCELKKSGLKIHTFYFPVFRPRTIDPLAIKAVYYEPHHFDFCTTKDWGMSFTPVWWALDTGRFGFSKLINTIKTTNQLTIT